MLEVDPKEFGRRTAEGRPCGHYDFSLYYGLPYSCACGELHDFKPWMEIVSELPLFRFVVACPDGCHLTAVKARWNRDDSLRELHAEFGTRLPDRRQGNHGVEFQASLLEAKTGRPWSLEETARLMEHQEGLTRMPPENGE